MLCVCGRKGAQARHVTCPLYFSAYINVLIEGTNNRKYISHIKGRCNVDTVSIFSDLLNNFSATCGCTCGGQNSFAG